jgi:Ca2+ transporting ATPase
MAVVCALLAITGAVRSPPNGQAMSRRSLFASTAALGVGVALPAFAADPFDTNRLVLGYNQVQDLLDNWDTRTMTKEGARDADVVRKVLGLRSTADPLFQLEKLLQKSVSKTDPDRLEEWIEATDSLNTHVNNANEFAYTAAFGEYNPGGGKDQVDKYMELSHKELQLVSSDLKKVLDLLSLKP